MALFRRAWTWRGWGRPTAAVPALLGDLERGDLAVRIRSEEFEPLMRRFEQMANRLVVGIIITAFIAGMAVLMAVYHPGGSAQWLGFFFAAGFAIALALGGYLAWSILRSGRRS